MTQLSLAFLLLALPAAAGAQQADSSRALLQTRGSFFALAVPDLEASTNWYVEKFGLTIVMRAPKQGAYTVTVLKGGGLTVELIQIFGP